MKSPIITQSKEIHFFLILYTCENTPNRTQSINSLLCNSVHVKTYPTSYKVYTILTLPLILNLLFNITVSASNTFWRICLYLIVSLKHNFLTCLSQCNCFDRYYFLLHICLYVTVSISSFTFSVNCISAKSKLSQLCFKVY